MVAWGRDTGPRGCPAGVQSVSQILNTWLPAGECAFIAGGAALPPKGAPCPVVRNCGARLGAQKKSGAPELCLGGIEKALKGGPTAANAVNAER